MPRKISFTKSEREALFLVLESFDTGALEKPLSSLLTKMDEASKPDTSGLAVQTFIDVCRGVLGDQLALPPHPSGAWYGRVGRALKESGLTEEDAKRVAIGVKMSRFRGPVSLDFIASRIATFLAKAKEEPSGGPATGWSGRKEFDG